MIEVEEAQALLRRAMKALGSRWVPVQEALGRVLANDITSPIDMPPFDRSAMDGYVLRSEDLKRQNNFLLIGQADAGHKGGIELEAGQACRIHTGAMIPEGADTVIRQEDVAVEGDHLNIPSHVELSKGSNIRSQGEELRKGDKALEAGTRLSPAGIAFLASLGITGVDVHERPRISLLYTGDELTSPGDELPRGSIYESNSFGIEALLREKGFQLGYKDHVPDDPGDSEKKVREALESCEVLLLSGGISVGDRDHVKEALMANGIEESFHKVRQKPGKPIFFGIGKGKYAFGLPGNPAASLVGMYEYAIPFLKGLEGDEAPFPKRVQMLLKGGWPKSSDRHVFLKASIEGDKVRPLEEQGSGMLRSFARADALISLPARAHPLEEGAWVDVDLLGS